MMITCKEGIAVPISSHARWHLQEEIGNSPLSRFNKAVAKPRLLILLKAKPCSVAATFPRLAEPFSPLRTKHVVEGVGGMVVHVASSLENRVRPADNRLYLFSNPDPLRSHILSKKTFSLSS